MEAALLYLIDHFQDLMRMNIIASCVILFVIVIRVFLKRAPKIFSYALWGIVLLRLLVPVSIESPMSVVPDQSAFASVVEVNEILPEIQFETIQDRIDNQQVLENTSPGEPFTQVSRSCDAETYLTFVWLFGIAIMLLRSIVSYWKLKRKLKVVIPFRKGIYLADDIDTPFVMGFFRPVIYLPGTLERTERKYIIAHERHHIHRGDHIFKSLGFLALTIHWFNPLVWVSFVLAGRDMEMSCDEAVIRKLGENVRAEYSASLLNLATGKRIFTGTPLAFGEGNPTGRVRNLAKWKKPALWVVLICVILCIVLAVCLLTNPVGREEIISTGLTLYKQYYTMNQQQQGVITDDFGTGIATVSFVQSSGPHAFAVELWYRGSEDMPWEQTEQQDIALTGTAIFHVPAGNEYVIMATPIEGNNGYATFDCKCQPGIHFADLDADAVTSIELKNLHNGAYSFLRYQDEKNAICNLLKGLSGINAGSGKGYYEGSYQIQLLNDEQVFFSIAVGDTPSFYYGKGEDGYPVRYILVGHDIKDIIAFLSEYDTSRFEWYFMEETQFDEQVVINSWNISINPDRVSRTGATALFECRGSIPGEEGGELIYGDFLSLERAENGIWVPVDELAGYEYYVGDSSYPVVHGYGMVHEWEDRFGKLQDGHYRMGKLVTLTRPDGSKEERMVYGEFSIPASVLTGPIPLEDLPELYSSELAAIDGCLVCRDGIPMDNVEAFREYADACMRGEPGSFRIVNWHYGDDPYYKAEDIIFDGNTYIIKSVESNVGIVTTSPEFSYLKHFTGEKEEERFPYDAYDHYVLVKDNNITWQEIFEGKYQGNYRPIFQNYIYYPESPDLPDNPNYAILEFNGSGLITITDANRLEKLVYLFENAEYLGYEPKTHSIGVDLNLIFANGDKEFIIELDPDSDLCRINGEYVFYGAYDEPEYTYKLWEYLGITQWPDIVYMSCENALKP